MSREYPSSLSIVHTPYHLLLAYGFAKTYRSNRTSRLIVVADFDSADLFAKVLRSDPENPFKEIIELPGNFSTGSTSRYARYLVQAKNSRAVRHLLRSWGSSEVIVFNDSRAEGQSALHYNHAKGGENIYIEDGLGAYSSSRFRRPKSWELLATKLFFGPWYQPVEVNGTHPLYDRHIVLMPEMVRPELKGAKICQLRSEVLLSSEGFCRRLLNETMPAMPAPSSVLLMPSSEGLVGEKGRQIARSYGTIVGRMAEAYGPVAVKFHPREEREEMFSEVNGEGIIKVPKCLPAEAILIPFRCSAKVLVGGVTTTMMTGSIILGAEARVATTAGVEGMEEGGAEDRALLSKLKVEVPASIDDLFRRYE